MTRLNSLCLALAFLCWTTAADAAKRKLTVDLETKEGALLKQITDEADDAKKTALLEDFTAKFPGHESATWAWGELQTVYLKTNQFDKALASGEKVFTADSDDLAAAHGNLKAAEGAKNPDQIRTWAVHTSASARRLQRSPKPSDTEEAAAWQAQADYAKQVDAYCDYALYSIAAQAASPAKRVEYGELLLTQSPGSQYAAPLRPQLFLAYQQSGNDQKALLMAEEDIGKGSASDDMLLYAASKAYERQDKAKAGGYAKKLLESLPTRPVPQGVSEADWTRMKNQKAGIAEWMLGIIASNEQRWAEADSHLRAALPNVSQSKDLQAETLFHLGLANYKMGEAKKDTKRITEALKFNQQCAAIASNYQAQAKKNVAAIRSQYRMP
ncbi:MAG TPA: hypothetical protein VFQ91_06935 [Bryobacteraceae bacterium]|nr:hypothetical protein [Bryobacteraceae bacterium]